MQMEELAKLNAGTDPLMVSPEVFQQIGTIIPAGSPLRPRYDAASKSAAGALDAEDAFGEAAFRKWVSLESCEDDPPVGAHGENHCEQ